MSETEKVARIRAIRHAKTEPRIEILVFGLSEAEALRIEAVCIDVIGFDKLTNLVTGHNGRWGGRRCVEDIIDEFSAAVVEVEIPAVIITINQTYFYGMSEAELYEATRGIWDTVGREEARVAMASYRGVIKEVYTIQSWHPAGTTPYNHRQFDPEDCDGRMEFIGKKAESDVRDRYISKRIEANGKIVKPGQNPIRYLNC